MCGVPEAAFAAGRLEHLGTGGYSSPMFITRRTLLSTVGGAALASVVAPRLAFAAQAQMDARAQGAPMDAGPSGSVGLRLADGSLIRVPCDRADEAAAKGCASSKAALESASAPAASSRAPLKRRAPVFDARAPGVVAGVRG